MKAISLHQPWASLLATGIKPHETRSWRPPKQLIGERIAIQAAKRPPRRSEFSSELMAVVIAQVDGLRQLVRHYPGAGISFDPDGSLPLGAVIATVRLTGWLRIDGNDWSGQGSGLAIPGRWPATRLGVSRCPPNRGLFYRTLCLATRPTTSSKTIHHFLDGNGRLLIPLQLIERGLLRGNHRLLPQPAVLAG